MAVNVLLAILPILATYSVDAARPSVPPTADPFADPHDDPNNPLRYIASNVLTAIAFALIILVALTQTFLMWRQGGKFMLALIIAEFTFATGFGFRFGLHTKPDSKGLYIAEYLFIVLSPCGFIAALYVLLGRMSRWLQCDKYLLIPARRITLIFVMSDVITFLIQATGGSVSISNDVQTALTGSHIFLAGLALQLASFAFFSVVYLRYLFLVYTREKQVWTRDSGLVWYNDWRALAFALIVGCIGILIRSVYRTIEIAQGFHGHLATVEGFFYGLDTLPLFLAISIFVPFWPGRFIPNEKNGGVVESRSSSEEEKNENVAVDVQSGTAGTRSPMA